MTDTVRWWAVICEARADAEMATTLADREICAQIDWANGILESLRQWRGVESRDEFTCWRNVRDIARRVGISATHLRVKDKAGQEKGGYREARMALLALELAEEKPASVVLMRDTDGDQGRTEGYHAARDSAHWSFGVILSLPHPRREAWALAGYEPETEEEEARLAGERQKLGFDPRSRAEELVSGKTHNDEGAEVKRSTKRVLSVLTGGDPERERKCWVDAPLDFLKRRGRGTGLSDYLEEIDIRLASRIGE